MIEDIIITFLISFSPFGEGKVGIPWGIDKAGLAKEIALFGTKKTKGTFANKIIDQYKNSKKLFIITFVPNKIYCLAGYWIEEVSPGKFESIFYQKTKQKINEYKNTKKEVDEFIKGINLEYKSIKKEINDFF